MASTVQSFFPNAKELIHGTKTFLVSFELPSLGHLFWACVDHVPNDLPAEILAFTTDRELTYEPFNNDFGPLDLGALTKYSRALCAKLESISSSKSILVHFTSQNPNKRTNAACLALCYMVVAANHTSDQA